MRRASPSSPELPIPLGAVPAVAARLAVRLVRAQALMYEAVAQAGAQLGHGRSARRVITAPGERPAGRVLADL